MRISNRILHISTPDYLIHKYLWPNLEKAAIQVRKETPNQRPIVLDVGCGNRPYANLFDGCDYRGMDRNKDDAKPDIIGDGMDIPLEAETIDIVLCTQVIEHVSDPQTLVNECYRVLKPGGRLLLAGPFFWPLHEEPYDFYRFTKHGFAHLLNKAGFTSYEIWSDGGDYARLFLSINLLLQRKRYYLLRILLNKIGSKLNEVFKSETCPTNYTIIARVKIR